MRNFGILLLLLSWVACTPKTGEKTNASNNNGAVGALKSPAPVIPLPTGDVRKKSPQPGAAPSIQIGKANTFKLDNGLTVIVVENHKLPRVSYRIFVDYDPVLEKDAAGYVDIMGEMLAKGTDKRTKAQLDEEIDFIGANISTDAFGVTGFCLTKHTDKMLSIMSDILLNPSFPKEELDKVKRRMESNLAQQKDNPNAIAGNVAAILRNGKDHPYGEIMTEASLSKITLDQIKSHYKASFKPNIAYLVVVGDVTRAQAEANAKKYFGGWQKGVVPTREYAIPRAPEKTQVDFVHKPGAVQSVINITYPVELVPGAPDAIRSRVTNAILGGYFNSRVNANLREGHGWTYGARTSLSADELVGNFNGTASVRNAVTDSSLTEFLKEMSRLATEPVSAEELQVVKNVITGQFSQSLEEPGTAANFALNTARYGLSSDYYQKYLEVLQAVTPEEVQMMAKKYIRPDRAHILVVGNRDEVAERLKVFSPEGRINFYDAYGNPVKMINTDLPPGMTAEKVLEDYVNAIGGNSKIGGIKDLKTVSTMKTRGPEFTVKTWQKGGSKITVEMSLNGQVMSKQIYNGQKGVQTGMGPAQDLDGQQLNDLIEQAAFCKEAAYVKNGYKMTLTGIEEIEGKSAYVVALERPDGKKSVEYYDTRTSLKIREIGNGIGPDGKPMTTTNDYADYRSVEGIMLPHLVTVSGVFPVPFKVILSEARFNTGIEEAVFAQ